MKFKVFVVVTVLLVPVSGVYAELHDRGGGLIYDDVLDITWLQDANLAVSETFGASVISTTGQMDWDTAIRWIEAMNASSYLGFNQWRLPKIMPINGASVGSQNL